RDSVMPSPFPGMDPYLEGDLWTSVNALLATQIVRQLMPKLRPHYVALPRERFLAVAKNPEPHIWIEIRVAKQQRVVTNIEILSPRNKMRTGRANYVERRNAYLQSSAHLIEVDLVRQGQR